MKTVSVFTTDPIKSWAVVLTGLCGLALAVFAGLTRSGNLGSNTSGLILGIVSGLFWYLAAILPLRFPDALHLNSALNSAAASTAVGAVCYLIPDATAVAITSSIWR
jgi:hypothetical protein